MRKQLLTAGLLALVSLAAPAASQAAGVNLSADANLYVDVVQKGCPRIWPPPPGCGSPDAVSPDYPGDMGMVPDGPGQYGHHRPRPDIGYLGNYDYDNVVMSCAQGRKTLRERGFRHVRTYRCGELSYRYTALWRGEPVIVRIRNSDGAILSVRPYGY